MIDSVDTIIRLGDARQNAERQWWAAVLALAECVDSESVEPARAYLAKRTILGQPADQLDASHLALLRDIAGPKHEA